MENYEKKYKEALSWAHSAIKAGADGMLKEDLERIFPELRESEDERIRKSILELVKQSSHILNPMNQKSMIAWLEKQGEHANFRNKIQVGDKVTRNEDGVLVNLSQLKRVAKPSEKHSEQNPDWSEEDERILNKIQDHLREFYVDKKGYPYVAEPDSPEMMENNWLMCIKNRVQPQPKQEWSKEDEKIISKLIKHFEWKDTEYRFTKEDCLEATNWLKSLKPNNWKPSEEQVDYRKSVNDT